MIAPKVTWHKMKCVVPVIKETLHDHVENNSRAGIFL